MSVGPTALVTTAAVMSTRRTASTLVPARPAIAMPPCTVGLAMVRSARSMSGRLGGPITRDQ